MEGEKLSKDEINVEIKTFSSSLALEPTEGFGLRGRLPDCHQEGRMYREGK